MRQTERPPATMPNERVAPGLRYPAPVWQRRVAAVARHPTVGAGPVRMTARRGRRGNTLGTWAGR